jgi:hemoglobin
VIVEYIRYEIEPSRWQAFEADYCHAREILLKSPHCLSFDLAQCVEEPSFYTLRIHWDSQEGHLKGFRNSPDFPAFLARVKPYLTNVREMRHYWPTCSVESLHANPSVPETPA